MTNYRLFLFDGMRHGLRTVTRTIPLFCQSELEALRRADERRQGHYAELWRLEHVVKIFEPD